ncbi:nitrite reductase/ring-hydroxylating ferredoxin subunit [Variovorax boronicumulans]|uniref:non-heme iron oxygenase ferredoxin subunit n=1 Tax=Variovorax boronicumulans TaxID=436515 RepID=UPI002784F3A8|nr:non-heme iron oxygenase ferredoxin subunit [Variovorax boronicumulans]MDP9994549.1 nitrite reductase/ring-hydroxylating ferredoxin subunit [Variovorax boronicumulans]MDQ0005752.1 nitrite reductase/ring-hydroxylating ferredoxin subunit [Variovorax boronicumulans]MDQ0044386.1 nitrite reductase/ring-hydroxylating ferredoxin subunit [Variovorax boronicumulans]
MLEGIPLRVAGPRSRQLAVFRVDGEVYVTDAACTHGRAWLTEGAQQGHHVQCPLHGGVFDIRTGAGLSPPCTVALRTYPARVEAGFVNIAAAPAETK